MAKRVWLPGDPTGGGSHIHVAENGCVVQPGKLRGVTVWFDDQGDQYETVIRVVLDPNPKQEPGRKKVR